MSRFDITYGLRKWKAAKLQWCTLVIGFSMFIAIFGLVLQLGEVVTAKVPSWILDKKLFYQTIGRKNVQGDFVAISGRKLENIQQTSGIESIAKIGFRNGKFKIDGQLSETFEVAYVDHNFIKSTVLTSLFKQQNQNDNLVLVSEEIMLRLNKNKKSSYWIAGETSSLRYQVIGVIPSSMKKVGQYQPDLILAESQLIHTLPFRVSSEKSAENIRRVRAIINSFPIYYAITSSKEYVEPYLIEQKLNIAPKTDSMISIREHQKIAWVISGIEFSPKLNASIKDQWALLLSLVIVFGFLNYFNLFNVAASRLVTRIDEFRIRLTIGASKRDILKQVITEQYPMIVLVLLIGGISYQLLVSFLSKQAAYQLYFDDTFSINIGYWLAASLVTISFIVLCACLPLLTIFKKSLFTRVNVKSGSKSSSLAMYTLVFVQLFFTLLVTLLTVNMLTTSIKHKLSYQFPESVSELEIKFKSKASLNPHTDGQRLASMMGGNTLLSWSDQPFIGNNKSLASIQINNDSPEQAIPVRLMFVSEHYFESVKASVDTFNGANIDDGFILNSTAIRILQQRFNRNLEQREIVIKSLLNQFSLPIVGKIDDLPHLGEEHTQQPVVYMNFKHANLDDYRKIYAYINKDNQHDFNEQANLWLNSLGIDAQITPLRSVKSQLEIINHTQITLLNLAVLMTTLVVFLLCASFYYQSHLMLRRQQVTFGIMRAIGAKPIEIVKFIFIRYSLIFSLAVLTACIFVLFNKELLEVMIKQELNVLLSIFFSALLTYLVLFISTISPTINFQRLSIMNLLRYRE